MKNYGIILMLLVLFTTAGYAFGQSQTIQLNAGEQVIIECLHPAATATNPPPPPPEDTLTPSPTVTLPPAETPTPAATATITGVQSGAALFTNGDKIMTMVDSITDSRSTLESYQYHLSNKLIDNGYTVDFVGPNRINFQIWDNDTGAYSGWTYWHWLNGHDGTTGARAQGWFETYAPDVVIIHAGTNGHPPTNINRVDSLDGMLGIVNEFRAVNPDVVIVLSKIMGDNSNYKSTQQDIDQFNAYMASFKSEIDSLAENHSTEQSPIVVVDFSDMERDTYTYDGIHMNEAGAIEMADRFYSLLVGE